MAIVEERIDRLYTLPLDEFTAARDALAKELRSAGEGATATRVKGLRKPNLAAWGLNQVARAHAEDVDELFAATERVREVQRKVMSGGKGDLRGVTDERNRVVARLVKLGSEILRRAGHATSQQTLSAIGDSLVAVASDEEGAELLRAGRLSRELKPQSVVDVGGLTLVTSEPSEAEPERPGRDLAALRAAVKDATKRKEEADRAVEVAEGEAERLAQAAEFARRAAEARRAEAAEAERALAEAEEALRRGEEARP